MKRSNDLSPCVTLKIRKHQMGYHHSRLWPRGLLHRWRREGSLFGKDIHGLLQHR